MCFTDGEAPTVFREQEHIARIVHRCGECDEKIQPKERYLRSEGLWDGKWSTHRTCAACALARDLMAEVEQASGCDEDERFCPFGQLSEACYAAESALSHALLDWSRLGGRLPSHAEIIGLFTRVAPRIMKERAANRAAEGGGGHRG